MLSSLGRVYCHLLASLGALVAVCDVRDAPVVVQEIRAVGGQAIPITASVEDGNRVIEECVKAFGRIDIVINNAGFVRDKAFSNMTLELWDAILGVHLHGTYQISHAAWPYMVKQKSGCIINTTSVTGIYGNYGQSNYAAAVRGSSKS
jgi:multifunctional beta-oxidation protein